MTGQIVSIESVAQATGTTVESWGLTPESAVTLFADGRLQTNSEHGVIVLAQPGSVDEGITDSLVDLHWLLADA